MQESDHDFHWHGPEPPMRVPARSWGENPYPHTYALDGQGHCDADCQACAWNKARQLKMREDLGYPARAYTPTVGDLKFLNDMKVAWYGDNRK